MHIRARPRQRNHPGQAVGSTTREAEASLPRRAPFAHVAAVVLARFVARLKDLLACDTRGACCVGAAAVRACCASAESSTQAVVSAKM
eukprot:6193750-Pleurochrysis_carterae.AAC.2